MGLPAGGTASDPILVGRDPFRAGRDPILLAITALAALLLLGRLGDRVLWQDEAETGLLAKSILRSGLPIASDGKNVVSQEAGKEFGKDFLWRWSPWAQFYLAAGSIGLLGPTPFAARLPFAILGLCCVPALYLLSRRLSGSTAAARLSALFLTLSVPFLLHARQARWYAAAYLLLIVLLLALQGIADGARRAPAWFAAAGTLLFYTNYFVALGALLALCAAAPALRLGRPFLFRLAAALLAVALLCAPGVVFFGLLARRGPLDLRLALGLFVFYLGAYLTFLLPLPMLFVAIFAAAPATGREPEAVMGRWMTFLLLFSLGDILYLSFAPWGLFRYMSVLLPPAMILLALGVRFIQLRSRAAGLVVILFLIFTNIFHLTPLGFAQTLGTLSADSFPGPGPAGSPLLGYLYERTHRFEDPEAALCGALNRLARPGDVALVTYGDLPLQFCSPLVVAGGMQGRELPDKPDWIVVRRFFVSADPGKDLDVTRFIQAHIDPAAYEPVDLGVADTMLGNDTDPTYHLFRPPVDAPPLVLMRRKQE